MKLKFLLALLVVYRCNFSVMRWNAKGVHFDKIHSNAEEYYWNLGNHADRVAEMSIRLKHGCISYIEAYELLKSDTEHGYFIAPSDTLYGFNAFVTLTTTMFNDILRVLRDVIDSEEIQNPNNVGIKAALEGFYEYYDKEARFINQRRSEVE